MGDQRTDFFRLYDFQPDVTRSSGRVEFDVGGSSQPYLAVTGAPYVAFVVEAVGSDAAWTVQEIDEDPRDSSDWRDIDSGTVSQGTRETVFVDRVTARNVALHLDGDGHEARVYQTAVPLASRLLAAGGDELVAEALDTGIASSTVGLVTYLSRALGSVAQDLLRVDLVQQTLQALDVRAQYIDARGSIEAGASEQSIPLQDPQGNALTETITAGDDFLDVRPYSRATVRVEAGGSTDTTAKVKGVVVEEADIQTLNSASITGGTIDDVIRSVDVTDFAFLQVTEASASDTSDTHKVWGIFK